MVNVYNGIRHNRYLLERKFTEENNINKKKKIKKTQIAFSAIENISEYFFTQIKQKRNIIIKQHTINVKEGGSFHAPKNIFTHDNIENERRTLHLNEMGLQKRRKIITKPMVNVLLPCSSKMKL